MNAPRTIMRWSTGAASAIAARLILREVPDAIIARCETNNEDPDNYRFEAGVMRCLNASVTVLRSDKFESIPEVRRRERYMAGINGASCTRAMKIEPRLAFQRPDDIHVFGYTADRGDVERFERLKQTYFELTVRAPLIEQRITEAATLAMVERAGLKLPRTYGMGFPNANCLRTGCVKAQAPGYWALLRRHLPDAFSATAAQARDLGVRLAKLNGERVFIDEIPADQPMTEAVVPACDFLCVLAEDGLESVALTPTTQAAE